MNIGDIITEVDTIWAPNTVTSAMKCRWLTQDQWHVYRKVTFPNGASMISTVAGTKVYPLPADCPAGGIQHVVLLDNADNAGNETEYRFRSDSDDANGTWYTVVMDTTLMLSEAPAETGLDLFLFYGPRPVAFSASSLTVAPAIPEDYHEYFVKKLAERCAKANAAAGGGARDALLANNYATEAAEILQQMIRDFAPTPSSGFHVKARW